MEAVSIRGGWLIIFGNLQSACGQGQGQFKSLKSCSILLQKRPEKRTPKTHTHGPGNSEISNIGNNHLWKKRKDQTVEVIPVRNSKSLSYWWGLIRAWSKMGENIYYLWMETWSYLYRLSPSILWDNKEEAGSNFGKQSSSQHRIESSWRRPAGFCRYR